MEEKLDIFTRDGRYIGVRTKSECHSQHPEGYHKPVWIWIINSKNEVFVQKRASTKKSYPDLWAMSSGGHVDTGETIISEAIRETEEELGIKTTENDYKLCAEYIDDAAWEIAQLYIAHVDFDIKDVKLQKEEVSDARWFSFDEFKKLIYSDKHVPLKKELRELVIKIIEENLNK